MSWNSTSWHQCREKIYGIGTRRSTGSVAYIIEQETRSSILWASHTSPRKQIYSNLSGELPSD
eukprot:2839384-Amphidinium_carterae.1